MFSVNWFSSWCTQLVCLLSVTHCLFCVQILANPKHQFNTSSLYKNVTLVAWDPAPYTLNLHKVSTNYPKTHWTHTEQWFHLWTTTTNQMKGVLWCLQTINTLEIVNKKFLAHIESRWRVTFALQMSAVLWVCAGAMRQGFSDSSGLSASAHTPLWIINHYSREKKIRADYYKCFQSVLYALTSLKPPYNTISDVPNAILPH